MILSCPHCHLTVRPRAAYLTMEYCPRCLAKRRVAEPLTKLELAPGCASAVDDSERPRRLHPDPQAVA